MRANCYAVYIDNERLNGGKNSLMAIFSVDFHAREYAEKLWGNYYIIEPMYIEGFCE